MGAWRRLVAGLHQVQLEVAAQAEPDKLLRIELRRHGLLVEAEQLSVERPARIGAVERSVLQWRFIDGIASRIDDAELRAAQQEKDAVRAYELVYAALGA